MLDIHRINMGVTATCERQQREDLEFFDVSNAGSSVGAGAVGGLAQSSWSTCSVAGVHTLADSLNTVVGGRFLCGAAICDVSPPEGDRLT